MDILKNPEDYAYTLIRWAGYNKLEAVKAALESQKQYPGMTDRFVMQVIHSITATR